MTHLEVKALTFLDYGPFDLTINSGDVFGITGPSGSGKTLFLKAIADMIECSGDVILDGESRGSVSAPVWRLKTMLIPAEPQWWHETVGEHFPSQMEPLECGAFGLDEDVLSWPVSRLSSGEKQRLGLARGMARRPQVLLLDEPSANLDEKNTELVEACILNFVKKTGGAAIWISHDREQLGRVASVQTVFEDKKLKEVEVSE
jgi:ABC-type iron transport system FetAB ATPase subunit